jgi:hypothetical protein
MDKDWWKSIGLWGSVYTTEEIAFILGVSKGRVLAHARGCGLRTAKPGKELEASMLAAVLYLHRDEDDMAGRYGVLEVERRRYILEAEAIVGKGESLAGIKSDDWRMMWAKASQQLAPTGLPADITERRAQIDHLRQTRPAPATQSAARAHKTSSGVEGGRTGELPVGRDQAPRHGLPGPSRRPPQSGHEGRRRVRGADSLRTDGWSSLATPTSHPGSVLHPTRSVPEILQVETSARGMKPAVVLRVRLDRFHPPLVLVVVGHDARDVIAIDAVARANLRIERILASVADRDA